MPLAPVVLDDLDWERLTDAARLRIPALSAGNWTLHAPVDPGITLIELYAWLLDQRVYWMNRVPEPLFRAVIELLGEQMRPVRAASTVLALEREDALTEVAPGTTLEIARAESGPVFATTEGIELLKVRRVGLVTAGPGGATAIDRANDLREQRRVTLFGANGTPGEARIVFYLVSPPPAAAPRPLSLFLDVQAPPKILPEWHPDSRDVAPPAELTWWYSRSAPLPPRQLAPADVHDGTRGLRRAGVVRLRVPADWSPDGPAVGGLTPYSLFLRTRASTFTFPPSVRRVIPNTAIARHRRVVRESRSITDWLPLPGLSITLDESSAPPFPDRVRLHLRERDGKWHRWLSAADFTRSGPSDRVFHVDRERRRIEFGDGLTGRIPRLDRPASAADANVHIAVAVGGGAGGNVDGGLSWIGITDAVRARAAVAAVGGLDEETMAQARVRIAGLLDRVERAVTPEDHVTLAENTPGVAIARAHAAVGFHPAHVCDVVPGAVTVFVVPWAPRGDRVDPGRLVAAPMPDPGALAAVRAHLDRARMVGTEVWVCPPRYRTVRLAVRVLGDPVDPAQVRVRIDDALRRFLDPLEGGDNRDGWPFGDPIRPSVLLREAVAAVQGADVESVAIGLDGAAPSEDCGDVPLGPHDLPSLADMAVTFEPDVRARAGGLR